ncbi:hypothetical protein OnM2_067025 [Erysiphe neolycopersici]|uniref:Uncharacterized protein n=1 Tax=Erysiphe neolycopersici TaxID=212602 RepID=A0A420HLZ9_9PEZI|nr:hypothetical protein OnM2_067025 [Erysiphe neolycopersici]
MRFSVISGASRDATFTLALRLEKVRETQQIGILCKEVGLEVRFSYKNSEVQIFLFLMQEIFD